MSDRYHTLAGESEGLYREKASRFIAYAFPIADEEDFKRRCDAIARAHHAARHVCYAWVLGEAGERTRANDANEPAGTAGKPMLRQLQGTSLTFAAVVVVRYFGGTLLGKAGLVHAYAEAARDALAKGTIVERVLRSSLTVTCSYAQLGVVKRDVLGCGGEVLHMDAGDPCTMRVAVARSAAEACVRRWREAGIVAAIS